MAGSQSPTKEVHTTALGVKSSARAATERSCSRRESKWKIGHGSSFQREALSAELVIKLRGDTRCASFKVRGMAKEGLNYA